MGIEAAIIGAAIAGAGASAYSAKKQSDAQKKAQRSAEAIAEKQKNQAEREFNRAEREFNRANAKTPDLAGIMASNKRAEGAGSTMLTGPQGVSQDALSLGKNTLLGG